MLALHDESFKTNKEVRVLFSSFKIVYHKFLKYNNKSDYIILSSVLTNKINSTSFS